MVDGIERKEGFENPREIAKEVRCWRWGSGNDGKKRKPYPTLPYMDRMIAAVLPHSDKGRVLLASGC